MEMIRLMGLHFRIQAHQRFHAGIHTLAAGQNVAARMAAFFSTNPIPSPFP